MEQKKKKVLIIGPGMEIGGVERSLLGLLDAIDYEKYDVDLFLFWHHGEFLPYINDKVHQLPDNKALVLIHYPIFELIKQGHFCIAAIRLFCKLYGDLRAKARKTSTANIMLCHRFITRGVPSFPKEYDIAIGFFVPHYLLTDKVNAKTKIGWVHTDYTNDAEKQDTDLMLPMWKKLDYIACVSEGVKNSFCNVYPQLASKTLTIQNVLSPKLIERLSKEKDVSDEMPDDGSVKLLSIGRFCTAKAFDRIPEICQRLVKQGYHMKWYLIGYGPDEQLIRQKIMDFHMEETVIILGRKTNPYPYLNAASIYAQPSRYEGKSVAVIEAQILHKPVLITRYQTSADQLKEGTDGFICEQGVDGIAKGVQFLIDNPSYRDYLQNNTIEQSYSNFSEIDKIWALR